MPPRRRRARPVADAPIDALLPRSEDLAKGWLLALLEQAPLDDAPAILATDLTRDGPRVCEAVLRAIADDTDLRRLEPGGVLTPLAARTGALAGAAAPAAVSRAVDALIGVIWAAVREELRGADGDLVAELTERLALIGELVRSAALERSAPGPAARPLSPAPPPISPVPPPPPRPEASPMVTPPPPVATTRPSSAPSAPPPAEPPAAAATPPAAASPPAASPPAVSPPTEQRAWPGLSDPPTLDPSRSLWVGALEDEIVRSAGAPLSLLLAELEDAERVTAVEPQATARATFTRFAGAVRSAVRRQDILVCESDARAWIIARDTARAGAHALGERIAAAVRSSEQWHGAPLVATVGVAVFGEDGRTSGELIEAAEEARFAAAAGGVDVLGSDEP
jgi:GGDEF domain-containing protein